MMYISKTPKHRVSGCVSLPACHRQFLSGPSGTSLWVGTNNNAAVQGKDKAPVRISKLQPPVVNGQWNWTALYKHLQKVTFKAALLVFVWPQGGTQTPNQTHSTRALMHFWVIMFFCWMWWQITPEHHGLCSTAKNLVTISQFFA